MHLGSRMSLSCHLHGHPRACGLFTLILPFYFLLCIPHFFLFLNYLKSVVNLHNSCNESVDTADEFSLSTRVEWRLVTWSWMLLQVRRIQRIFSRNHCRDAKSVNGQNMLVRDGCMMTNGLTRCSAVSSNSSRTRIFGKLSAVSAVSAVASSKNGWERAESIERGQVKRGQVSKLSVILETNESGRRVELSLRMSWWNLEMGSKSMVGRLQVWKIRNESVIGRLKPDTA